MNFNRSGAFILCLALLFTCSAFVVMGEEYDEGNLTPLGTFSKDSKQFTNESDDISLFAYSEDDDFYDEMWEHEMINSEDAWEMGALGNNIRVAVIDSGCNYHEDLEGRIVASYNYFTNTEDVPDEFGHGTAVAGIIAANRGNGVGFTGVAPRVELVILKTVRAKTNANGEYLTDAGGNLIEEKCSSSTLVQAIKDATEKYNCDIINMSIGVDTPYTRLKLAINDAVEAGVTVVAAAGNKGDNSKVYPAYYNNVISVGAVDKEGTVWALSQKNDMVNVVAPGENVCRIADSDKYMNGGNGTSFACPYVTGICAALLSADSSLTPTDLMNILQTTAVDKGPKGKDNSYGYGIVDFGAAMRKVTENSGIYLSAVDTEDADCPVFITNTSVNASSFRLYYKNNNGETASTPVTVAKGRSSEVSLKALGASLSDKLFVAESDKKFYCITTRAEDGLDLKGIEKLGKFSIDANEDLSSHVTNISFKNPIYKTGAKCNMTVSLGDERIYVGELYDDVEIVNIPFEHHLPDASHICPTLGEVFEVTLWSKNSSKTAICHASHAGNVDEDGNVHVHEEGAKVEFDELYNMFSGTLFYGWLDKFGNYIDLTNSHKIHAHKYDLFTPVYSEYTTNGDNADVKTNGTSVRVKNVGNGQQKDLRIISRIKKDFLSTDVIGITNFDGGENVRYGHLVLPAEEKFIGEGELLEIGKATSKGYVPKQSAAVHTYSETDEYVEFSVCITGITKGKAKRHYIVRPYINYTDDNHVERTVYGQQYTTNSLDEVENK